MDEEPIKRDEKGRWIKGNPPGPGRPKGSTLKEYQEQDNLFPLKI